MPCRVGALAVLLVAHTMGTVAAQSPGDAFVRVGASAPPGQSAAVEADVRIWRGVSVVASVRKWGVTALCTDSSPAQCSPEGVSGGLGLRLTAESDGAWWPFAQAVSGYHRYSHSSAARPFLAATAGIGWYVGDLAALEVGAIVEQMRTDPSPSELVRPGRAGHLVTGVSFMVGVRVG